MNKYKIGIIGLGYVGLPLAVEFGKHYITIGHDTNEKRINELKNHYDHTLEVSKEMLKTSTQISYSVELNDLRTCNVYIITVPTPVDKYNRPDLNPLMKASKAVAQILKKMI